MLVLSLFPGVDLLGRGFEAEGYCVVRGPDPLWGGDIRSFEPPARRFEGVIGGSPCQDFSSLRRCAPTGEGVELLGEFVRCVEAAQPEWFLLENVPGVPDVAPHGYTVQRFDLRASECGLPQQRLRHFQFGSRCGMVLALDRDRRQAATAAIATASEGRRQQRRTWEEFCALQGLSEELDLSALTMGARYKAVGNGVPLPMARFVARAIRDHQYPVGLVNLCACGCGRRVRGKQVAAAPACRKRLERRRRDCAATAGTRRVTGCDPAGVTEPDPVTPARSQ